MKKSIAKFSLYLLAIITVSVFFTACTKRSAELRTVDAIVQDESLNAKLDHLKKSIAANTMKLDSSEYKTYHYLDWFRLPEPDTDVSVIWHDGYATSGQDAHHKKLKTLFAFAPDTKITESPLHVGWDNENAAFGIMTGTFTEPIHLASGKKIKPNKKTFSIPVYAISTQKDGLLTEMFFYWDHSQLLSQLGL